MPLVSIVIPVYKAEDLLPRCLDSILAQTMLDWECVMVDDGSPDGSGAVCDRYAAQDRSGPEAAGDKPEQHGAVELVRPC